MRPAGSWAYSRCVPRGCDRASRPVQSRVRANRGHAPQLASPPFWVSPLSYVELERRDQRNGAMQSKTRYVVFCLDETDSPGDAVPVKLRPVLIEAASKLTSIAREGKVKAKSNGKSESSTNLRRGA